VASGGATSSRDLQALFLQADLDGFVFLMTSFADLRAIFQRNKFFYSFGVFFSIMPRSQKKICL
jgi:hypothetical protein